MHPQKSIIIKLIGVTWCVLVLVVCWRSNPANNETNPLKSLRSSNSIQSSQKSIHYGDKASSINRFNQGEKRVEKNLSKEPERESLEEGNHPTQRVVSGNDSYENIPHLNRTLHLHNIMFLWTQGKGVKVVTLLVLNQQNGKVGVLTFPLNSYIQHKDFYGSIRQYYSRYGLHALQRMLAEKLEIYIKGYVAIDQETFEEFSDLIGPIQVEEQEIDFDLACELTSTGKRKDDQAVIRAFSHKITEPLVWLKMPKILWLLTSQVNTDLNTNEMLGLYYEAKDMELHNLIKRALPTVKASRVLGEMARPDQKAVDKETWCNILYWLTE